MMFRPSSVVRRILRFRKSETGNAMIELAVALPLLVLIAIGVTDYGRVYFTSIAVANAARAGAEWGAQDQGTSVNQNAIKSFAQLDGAEAGTITFASQTIFKCNDGSVVTNTSTCPGYGVPQVYIQVTATKILPLLMNYPGLPTSVTIARTATFREQ
jgi:Flp pilus assembly protein TadG